MIADITNGIFYSNEDEFRKANKLDEQATLPRTAIFIEQNDYNELLALQSQGAVLKFDDEGVHAVMPKRDAAAEREYAINAIDAAADAARTRDNSIGQLLDVEYQQVIEAHSRWYAEGYDEAKCPEEITAWANAEGISALQAASDIAEAAAHREEVIRQIRTIRLEGKAAIRSAGDDADFAAIAQRFIKPLGGIGNQ
ncbi:hypothetical protein [Zymobacter palmae]|uniref:DNA-directed RNA polymerases n=1 Tax=Zymobacter palmae TaxID=33074 RepID=A0A348HEA0_9GAMM|nr:hypothetical protein [Zymobacter palmae]BBG29952.1 DNA-directed RNA polymerases [Zymobacter palmae]